MPQIILGDCIEEMAKLPASSVDLIATDLPYGTTANKWDSVIPAGPMWAAIKRVLKPKGTFITTGSQPFTSALIMSNLDWFKAEIIWEKEQGTNFFNVKYQPYKVHENILVFSSGAASYSPKGNMTYNPEMIDGAAYKARNDNSGRMAFHTKPAGKKLDNTGKRYPRSVVKFNRENGLHETQKPVALYEYIIKTWSNPGELILDFCAGSGTTGQAAKNTGRNFILIENNLKHYQTILERLKS